MKLTKSQLKQIIKEELEDSSEPKAGAAAEDLKERVEFLGKSFVSGWTAVEDMDESLRAVFQDLGIRMEEEDENSFPNQALAAAERMVDIFGTEPFRKDLRILTEFAESAMEPWNWRY